MASSYVKVTEVKVGDVVRLAGRLVHDDLAGRMIEEHVVEVEPTADGRTFLHWPNGTKTWWSNLETVRVVAPMVPLEDAKEPK